MSLQQVFSTQWCCLQKIHKHENAHIAYQKQLSAEGVVKQEQIDEIHDNISKILSSEFEQVSTLLSNR